MIAKFPSKCCVCEEQFIPGESEIEQHPTMRGPKGGKKFMHVECAGGAHDHDNGHGDEEIFHNPREIKKGKGKFKQTAHSVQAQMRHQNLLEDISQSELGGYEYALAGRAPTRKFQQVENPFMNAGRRTKKGKPNTYRGGKTKGLPRLPRLPDAANCDVSGMSKEQLVRQGDAAAKAELARRGRNAEGTKLAWLTKKNPFGYEF